MIVISLLLMFALFIIAGATQFWLFYTYMSGGTPIISLLFLG